MRMLAAPALLLLLLQTQAAPPLLEVRLQADGTRVRAESMPLARVLEEMAHRGDWELEFMGARPEQRVTVDIDAGSEAEALLRLFDGLPVTYAAGFDASGLRVNKLIVVASGSPGRARRPPASTDRRQGSKTKGGSSRTRPGTASGQKRLTPPVSPSAASYPRRPAAAPRETPLTPPTSPSAASYPRRPAAAPREAPLTPPTSPSAASYPRRR